MSSAEVITRLAGPRRATLRRSSSKMLCISAASLLDSHADGSAIRVITLASDI